MEAKLKAILSEITAPDKNIYRDAIERANQLIKPQGSLGRLEQYYALLSSIQKNLAPSADERALLIFSGDHGVFEENVAVCPQNITIVQTNNFVRGLTGACAIAKQAGAKVYPVDVGINGDINIEGVFNRKVAYGTNNLSKTAAMTREQAVAAVMVGIDMVKYALDEGHYNILATGEMGICNTTPSAAILAAFTGLPAEEVTGMGANLDAERVKHKIEVVRRALQINQVDVSDPIDVLAKLGGYEIAAMAGAFIGAAYYKTAIVVDGFIATISAIIATKLSANVKEYLIASHRSEEKGAKIATELLGLNPPLDLNLRLGEGSGALLMFNILDAACFMGKEMITFAEQGIDII